jgi:D-alanyl-D-alanine carboxypeptidase (penicillin-binding protein 5/6)
MKTGYTENAGFCLIASAKRGARRLLSVVLGAGSDSARAQESQKLLNYGFQFYDSVKLYGKDQAVSTLEVLKGSENRLKAGFQSDFYVSVPRGLADQLKADLVSMQPLVAPISAGQKVGTVKVTLQNKLLGEYSVVALENVALAGFFGRAWDGMRLWLK